MLRTSLASILLVLLAAVLGAGGQFLFKHASQGKTGLIGVLLSPWALAGMLCYVTVMVLFTTSFRLGGSVRVLYPLYASTFIWAAVLSLILFGHPIRPIHGLGMVLLIVGIVCMSW
jgi:multidrug transporter EmrE-like cation transporter